MPERLSGGELFPAAVRWLRRRVGAEPDALDPDALDKAPADDGPPTENRTIAALGPDASSERAANGPDLAGPDLAASSVATGGTDGASVAPASIPPVMPPPRADEVPELREMLDADRNNPQIRWQLGLALVAARKLNLALAHLEVAATRDPSLDQGELGEVRELQKAERLARRYPRDPELRLALGRLYLGLDQGDAALAELEEAARLRPDLAPAHTLLGFEYAYRGRIARAREHWGRARELDPADEVSQAGLAAIADGRDPLGAIWQHATP
jgi:tetratricopeptide (TPR) repeat protein